MAEPKKSLYPEVKRGVLSTDHEKYVHPKTAQGPKMGNLQNRILIIGFILIVIVTLLFVFSFKLTDYFKPNTLNY